MPQYTTPSGDRLAHQNHTEYGAAAHAKPDAPIPYGDRDEKTARQYKIEKMKAAEKETPKIG